MRQNPLDKAWSLIYFSVPKCCGILAERMALLGSDASDRRYRRSRSLFSANLRSATRRSRDGSSRNVDSRIIVSLVDFRSSTYVSLDVWVSGSRHQLHRAACSSLVLAGSDPQTRRPLSGSSALRFGKVGIDLSSSLTPRQAGSSYNIVRLYWQQQGNATAAWV
jgi:hypothetical protein